MSYTTTKEWAAYRERRKTWSKVGGYSSVDAYEFSADVVRRHNSVNMPRVVDLAGGSGEFLDWIGASTQSLIVDSSQEALDNSQGWDVSLQTMDNFSLLAKADVVSCLFALYHADNPENVIARAADALKPGGIFIATSIDIDSLGTLFWSLDGHHPMPTQEKFQIDPGVKWFEQHLDVVEAGMFTSRVDFGSADNVKTFVQSCLTLNGLAEAVNENTPTVDFGVYQYIVGRKCG